MVHNNCQIIRTHVMCAISNSAGAFFEAAHRSQESSALRSVAAQEASWATPPPQFTKINVDASWSALTCTGFVGIILRDAGGSFVAAIRHAISAPCVGAAEAKAISKGCEFGLALGLRKVIVESDSQDSICSLSDSLGIGRWEAFPSLVKAKRLGESFQDCRWSWIPRSANMMADSLALQRYVEMCDVSWVNRPPSSLFFVLQSDGLPCPP